MCNAADRFAEASCLDSVLVPSILVSSAPPTHAACWLWTGIPSLVRPAASLPVQVMSRSCGQDLATALRESLLLNGRQTRETVP